MLYSCCCFCSVPKSCPTLCDPISLGVCSNSCPLSQWCYPTISSSATLFCFCLQSFPASESFSMDQLFIGSQSIAAQLAIVLPVNIQVWFPLGLTGLISLCQGTLKSLLQHHNSKALIKKNFYLLFFYIWLCWVFVALPGLSLIAVIRGCSSLLCLSF